MPTPASPVRGPSSSRVISWARLGPFFGLFLVVAIFAAGLALMDIHEARSKSDGGWFATAWAANYDGLRAFLSVSNIKIVLIQSVVVALGALGMTLVIVSGGIDLSAGSSVALTSVLAATLLVKGLPSAAALALTILAGGALVILGTVFVLRN